MTKAFAFELLHTPLSSLSRWTIRHQGGAELEVLAGFGAGLNGWRVPTAHGKMELLAGYASEEDLRSRYADTSAGVRLSPFPNRLNGGKWSWQGMNGELPINFKWQPHAIHGLLHTLPWNFVSFHSDEEAAELTLERRWNAECPGFPFPFVARTTVRMEERAFTVKSQTVNVGESEMPYGEGWHPYFCLGDKVDSLEMRTPVVDAVLVNDLSIPTGERRPFTDFADFKAIGDRFIDNCWAIREDAPRVETILRNKRLNAELRVWQQNGPRAFRYIQTYTPGDRQSVAIEPMTCEPDALNHHRDLLVLGAHQVAELEWGAVFAG